MTDHAPAHGLETKFCALDTDGALSNGPAIEGYASLFGVADRGGDVVASGAFGASLAELFREGRKVKMLWQHDPRRPIGVWDEVVEDSRGLRVKGRLLTQVTLAREAQALMNAGAIDGLSIGYRTVEAEKSGSGRVLRRLELWEVSLVTFPMLPDARIAPKGSDAAGEEEALAEVFATARAMLA